MVLIINYDTEVKFGEFQPVCGRISQVFRTRYVERQTLWWPCGCGLWTTTKRQESRIETSEMVFLILRGVKDVLNLAM